MNKSFFLLGGTGAALLLGSFLVEELPRDIMRLLGFILLLAYCVFKIMRSGRDKRS